MESVLKLLKTKEIDTKQIEKKNLFVKIESRDNKTLYHTKIMNDLYIFGINKNQKHKFFISFRGLFNQTKIESFHLFHLKDEDKFLGIYYGYRKPVKNVVRRYEEHGVMKASTFSKVCYIEFRFKKGSVFCYIVGISYLIKKEKTNTKYCITLFEIIVRLEKQIYEFYNKKLPEGGLITKWIEKNLK
ncbi:DUF226 domain-containing protein (plasmid) [Borrelia miyamotoi]|uniref:DUF226 domain-containing protein n=1 Tax=Borrelia miyamotoi TaxID=47466 RepID=A0A5P8ARM6_9SPIR|nr:DUF226 domain-containing protein [Borrelia miyamotoi]QFP42551.1 DUF226 domain-containing protein [Borrelia miyamotoi]WAZ72280.1 DUF226 domain-containing protein [Borrelia miyamotoi]WVI05276.1 DUF226 domain-containing protein [Borrelia miyamotoi]